MLHFNSQLRNKELILFLLIISAFIVRVSLIWIGRPEFVGWFNHTYYYFVETQGLLETGKLPFPDMPMLFKVYYLTAKALILLGFNDHFSIINATRFWMCLLPSLIPLPVFLVFKNYYKGQTFPYCVWVILLISAFYPLSIVHLPEYLQKNVLGLLLLGVLMQQTYAALEVLKIKRIISIILVFLLIMLTHYGSTGVALLFISSIIISLLINESRKRAFWISLGLIFSVAVSFYSIYTYDYQRFIRIINYANRLSESSIIGLVFSSNDPDKFTTIFMLLAPLGLVVLPGYWFWKSRDLVSKGNRVFWLTNIVFCYLLLLPIYEPLLLARFVNFLTLPLIFILFYTLQYVVQNKVWERILLGVALLGTITIAVGDITSLVLHNRNKGAIYNDLVLMKEEIKLNNKDLIITRNGAEHVSNWFLGTKSCLITSFNINDFKKYNRVFILNPTEGAMKLRSSTNSDVQKYNYMLSNIREPENPNIVYKSAHIKLVQLRSSPENWEFDKYGNWISYD